MSGAHLNPAVTLAQAVRREVPLEQGRPLLRGAGVRRVLSALRFVLFNYHAAINSFDTANHIVRGAPDSVPTYSIFATFPAVFHSWVGPFVDLGIGTAFLVGFIFAITDEFNAPVKGNLASSVIVVAIGLSYGANAGYAIDPARDYRAAPVALIAGWKSIAMPRTATSTLLGY